MSAVLLIAAIAALGIYACRTDPLSWWEHPLQMAGNVAGTAGAAWAMWQSGAAIDADGHPGADAVVALLLSAAWLVATYRRHAHETAPSAFNFNPLDR